MKYFCKIMIIVMVILPIHGAGQILWVDNPENPVLTVDGLPVWDCCVLEVNDTLKMWYSGSNDGIFYAWSIDDGANWENLANPVLPSGGNGTWEWSWLDMPRVMFDGTTYRMWYMGENSDDYCQVGLATSLNGIDWVKSDDNPIFGPGAPGSWDGGEVSFGGVVHDGTQYVALYSGSPGNSLLAGLDVGRAVSEDGTVWTRDLDPILTYPEGFIAATTLLISNDGYEAFYTYGSGNTQSWKFGYATSIDGESWNLDYPTPLFTKSGLYIAYVFESENIPIYRMWYGYRNGRYIENASSLKGFLGLQVTSESYMLPGSAIAPVVRYEGNFSGLEMFADIDLIDHTLHSSIQLFDDGLHYDGESSDSVFSNSFVLDSTEAFYIVGLTAKIENEAIIEYNDLYHITTAGPLVVTETEQLHPPGGAIESNSNVYFNLSLQNLGSVVTAEDVRLTIEPADTNSSIMSSTSRTTFGDIAPGETVTCLTHLALKTASDLEAGTPILFNAKISSNGISYWEDTGLILGHVALGDEQPDMPQTFSLSQNYPNPFNPMTNIRYSIPENSQVRLVIYDVLGREVIELINGFRSVGNYETTWNGLDKYGNPVNTGVYLARLESGRQTDIIKMLYLK